MEHLATDAAVILQPDGVVITTCNGFRNGKIEGSRYIRWSRDPDSRLFTQNEDYLFLQWEVWEAIRPRVRWIELRDKQNGVAYVIGVEAAARVTDADGPDMSLGRAILRIRYDSWRTSPLY
jgi:hypothetical protein